MRTCWRCAAGGGGRSVWRCGPGSDGNCDCVIGHFALGFGLYGGGDLERLFERCLVVITIDSVTNSRGKFYDYAI